MKKFILGLVAALILGTVVNGVLGYVKLGYFKNPTLIWGGLFKGGGLGQTASSDVKDCKDLIAGISTFGNLKVTIIGGGKPAANLEVDLSKQPGPVRCEQKTDKNGVVSFENVPTGSMFIFFNEKAFPKEFGQPPTEPVTILQGQTVEKRLELKAQ